MQIMKEYTQLTEAVRYQLLALNQSGIIQTKISVQLGVNQPSMSRELKRNTAKRGYRVKQVENKAIIRRKN